MSGRDNVEESLARFLQNRAGESGFETKRLPVAGQADNLLISYQRDPDLPWILFDSHLDTVTVDGMIIDPFGGVVREDKVWGRGACDTKGSGASMFEALIRYSNQKEGNNNIFILYSIDEEQGMSGIRSFVEVYNSKSLPSISGAIVGEPTRLTPVIAHNGVQRFRLRTRGVAVHSADPTRGKSAISAMVRLISYLEAEYIPSLNSRHDLTGKSQCSINMISGGSAINIIPDQCTAFVDRRLVPLERPEAVEAGLKKSLDRFRSLFPDDEIEIDVSLSTPPLQPHENSPFLESALQTLVEIDGKSTGRGAKYATHAGDLSRAEIPSIVLGPGDIAQGHTEDEWIEIEQLQQGVEVYLELMARA